MLKKMLPELLGRLKSQRHTLELAQKAVETVLDNQATLTTPEQIERNSKLIDRRIAEEKALSAEVEETEKEIAREQELDFDVRKLMLMLCHAALLLKTLETRNESRPSERCY